jgi:hypothetical protein
MGALFMNMRPFFPATEVMTLFFRPRTTIPPSLLDEYARQGFVSPAFRDFMVAFKISAPLSDIIEDVITVRTVGAESILNTAAHSSLSALVDMRDVLIHRILSLAPTGNEPEDESSAEECIRLAALIFVMDKLFLPVLPPAYHGIVHLVTDRLSTTIEGKAASQEWAGHGWVLMWIVLVSATAHNGDATTKKSLIQSAAPLFTYHLSALGPASCQLRSGLTCLVGRLKPFEEEMIDEFAAELEQLCSM